MRNCSCPILFTHQAQEWRSNRLLACVEATDLQHARLNKTVIRDARALAEIVGMDLYIVSVYQVAIDADKLPLEGLGHEVSPDRLAEHYGIESSRICCARGRRLKP